MHRADSVAISLAVYLDQSGVRYPIYLTAVCAMLIAFVCLPLVTTEVSVGSPGVLRSVLISTAIKAPSSGVVDEARTRENLRVAKGELLVRVHSVELEERKVYSRKRLTELTQGLRDIEQLSALVEKSGDNEGSRWEPVTPLYRQWLSDFRQRYRDALGAERKARRDHDRNQVLFSSDVIAANEMEQAEELLRRSEEDVARVIQTHLTEWRKTALDYEREIDDLTKELSEVTHQESLNEIVSPVNGTLHQIAGLYAGSPVFSGQTIGYISPDTTLVAEVHVAPGDIGFLRRNMPVRFQVAAFNYTQWGLVSGQVTDVSEDVIAPENDAYYVVICSISRSYLELPGGYRGDLRKGMSLHARFIVGRRSLWQLLFDKADNWLNPTASELTTDNDGD